MTCCFHLRTPCDWTKRDIEISHWLCTSPVKWDNTDRLNEIKAMCCFHLRTPCDWTKRDIEISHWLCTSPVKWDNTDRLNEIKAMCCFHLRTPCDWTTAVDAWMMGHPLSAVSPRPRPAARSPRHSATTASGACWRTSLFLSSAALRR